MKDRRRIRRTVRNIVSRAVGHDEDKVRTVLEAKPAPIRNEACYERAVRALADACGRKMFGHDEMPGQLRTIANLCDAGHNAGVIEEACRAECAVAQQHVPEITVVH